MSEHQYSRQSVPALSMLLGVLFFASPAYAQVMPASAYTTAPAGIAATDIRYMQVGDTYRVVVERQGVKREFEGVLAKANEKWMVLITFLEGRTEKSVPVLGQMPYVNRLFRNVGVGRSQQYHWLPREAVTIKSRTATTKQVQIQLPQPEAPPSDTGYFVELVKDGKEVAHTAKFAFAEQYLICHQKVYETRVRGVPVLSDIPVVGRAFRKERVRVEVVDEQFSWNEVLCITPRELPPDPEK